MSVKNDVIQFVTDPIGSPHVKYIESECRYYKWKYYYPVIWSNHNS